MNVASLTLLGRNWVTAALLLGTVGLFAACRPAAKLDAGPQAALGTVAAEVTAELLQKQGKVVLLVSADDQKPVTGTGKALAVFQEQLKNTGVQVQAIVILPAPGGPLLSGMEPVPAARFIEALTKHATADAIVSFVGAPRFDGQQMAQLPNPRPKFIAVVTFSPPLRAMFASGVLHAAFIPRASGQAAAPSASVQERFDANYQLIRADNTGLLPL